MVRSKQAAQEIYVARESFYYWPDGENTSPIFIKEGQTRIRGGDQLLKTHASAFEPISVSPGFDVEQTTAAPGERRNVTLTTQGETSGEDQ